MKRTIYIFERGINGWQSALGDWTNWPNQACVWIHQNTPHKAQTLTYFTTAALSGLTRSWRAEQFAKLIQAYVGWNIVLVMHSEGTATGLRALKLAGWPRIEELHLICGAADSDFEANGLNAAFANERVGKGFVYVAGQDKALKLEDTYVGSVAFGLQTAGQPLGLKGPTNESPLSEVDTQIIHWPDYGHSTCWQPENFDRTMSLITGIPTF